MGKYKAIIISLIIGLFFIFSLAVLGGYGTEAKAHYSGGAHNHFHDCTWNVAGYWWVIWYRCADGTEYEGSSVGWSCNPKSSMHGCPFDECVNHATSYRNSCTGEVFCTNHGNLPDDGDYYTCDYIASWTGCNCGASAPYTWPNWTTKNGSSCSDAGAPFCSFNGSCGSANGQKFISFPPAGQLCSTPYGYSNTRQDWFNYFWTCNHGCYPGSDASCSAIVADPAISSFAASPTVITLGKTSNLTWSSTNTTYCQASSDHVGSDGGWATTNNRVIDPGGTITVTPPALGLYTYQVTCFDGNRNNWATAPRTATVEVVPPPNCDGGAHITWSKKNPLGKYYADKGDQIPFSWGTNDWNNSIPTTCSAGMTTSPNPISPMNATNGARENVTDDQNIPYDKNCTLTVDNKAGDTVTCATEKVCVRKFKDHHCVFTQQSNCTQENCGKRVNGKEAECWATDSTCGTGDSTLADKSLCDNKPNPGVRCATIMENCPPCGQEYEETN